MRTRYSAMMGQIHLTEEEKETMLKNVLAAKPRKKRPLLRLAAVAVAALLIVSAGAAASVATTDWRPGLPRFFTREEDIVPGGSGDVAGVGEFLRGGTRGQTILDWVNIQLEPEDGDYPPRTGGPEDG